MKKITLITMMAVIGLFAACKKDNPDSPSSSFTAKIDGEAYSSANVTVKTMPPNPDINPHLMMVIAAADKNSRVMGLSITFENDQLHTGTFEINNAHTNAIVYTYSGGAYGSDIGNDPTGVIIITKISDHHVQGAFSGTIVNGVERSQSKMVADGHFNVSY